MRSILIIAILSFPLYSFSQDNSNVVRVVKNDTLLEVILLKGQLQKLREETNRLHILVRQYANRWTSPPIGQQDTTITDYTPLFSMEDYRDFERKMIDYLPVGHKDIIKEWMLERLKHNKKAILNRRKNNLPPL